jgi:flap endonuclease-1
MVTAMRAHGVQPIAIWDERGVRDWKAPEVRPWLGDSVLRLGKEAAGGQSFEPCATQT